MSLDPITINDAMNVRAGTRSVSRAQIGGAVVIYDLKDVPAWLEPILLARDEDGDPSGAIEIDYPPSGGTLMYCTEGTSITGEPK